ncbi:flippase [bacterium]|nr:flippase [bacterium]
MRGGHTADTLGTIIARFGGYALSFIVATIIARTFGSEGYGSYSFALAWLNVMVVFAVFGGQTLVVRNYAAYNSVGDYGKSHGILTASLLFVSVWSVILTILLRVTSSFIVNNDDPLLLHAFQIGIFGLPFVAISHISEASLRSVNKTVIGQLISKILRPILMIAAVGTYVLLKGGSQGPLQIVWILVASFVVTSFTGLILQRIYQPREVTKAKREYEFKAWLTESLPLFSLNFFTILTRRLETILIGLMTNAHLTGLFNVAFRGADLLALPHQSIVFVVAPTISKLYAAGKWKKLQMMVYKSAGVSVAFSTLFFLMLLLFREQFLSIFGEKFLEASSAMMILALGDLVKTLVGPSGLVLTMTKRAPVAFYTAMVGAVIQVSANLVLIPRMGIEGAAIANAFGLNVRMILSAVMVYRYHGIHTSVFGYLLGKTTPRGHDA